MSYIYLLQYPQSKYIYIGFTNDLKTRIKQHRRNKPGYKLVYYEFYTSEKDARKRERQLKKYGSSLGHLKKRIFNGLARV